MTEPIDHRAEAEQRMRASDWQWQQADALVAGTTGAMREAAAAQVHATLDLADAVRTRPPAEVPPGPCPSIHPLSGVEVFSGARMPPLFCDLRSGHAGDHESLPSHGSGSARWSDRDVADRG